MARFSGVLVSDDESFKTTVGGLLRSSAISIGVGNGTGSGDGTSPDLIVVDARGNAQAALSSVERLKAAASSSSIFVIAAEASPDLILQAMRSGANEFLTWPVDTGALGDALRRMAARRDSSPVAKRTSTTLAFLGAKGGSGTTTILVNCGVELARLSKRPTVIVDLKPGLGEVTLFLGVRSQYTLIDAVDNLHRLDEQFLRELVVKHKSGVDILAGATQFDRPAPGDTAAIEEVLRLLAKQHDYVLVDAGSQINACSVSALYGADIIYLVTNPDVPSVRNAQRLLEKITELGACGERVRILLNRASEPYPISPAQIQTALGRPIDHMFPSDYRTVSTAFNTGVPLALMGNSSIASQFDRFTQRIIQPAAETGESAPARSTLGLHRLASLW
jgi:pilus assembly protein CpaE